MKNSNLYSLLLVTCFIFLSSCGKDDEVQMVNLLDYEKKVYQESKVVVGRDTLTVFEVQNQQAEDLSLLFFLFRKTSTEGEPDFIASSISNQNINGDTIIAKIDNVEYHGSNFMREIISPIQTIVRGTLLDVNDNGLDISIILEFESLGLGNSTITVEGDVAYINGTLGGSTYNQILDLNQNHRSVHTLLLQEINGSVNDMINLPTGRLIREAGYTTWINKNSRIASGAVDMFCAGKKRVVEEGAYVGVHSWCCGTNDEPGSDLPRDDEQHNIYIDYLTEMLGSPTGEDFYFFTIEAAAADGIYQMTSEEITKYKLATN